MSKPAASASSSAESSSPSALSALAAKLGPKSADKKAGAASTAQVKKARRQVTHRKNLQREESGGEYNIWYHKYVGNKRERWEDKEPADTRVNIQRDAGWTMGESQRNNRMFCLHFAHGSCDKGHECRYLHRLPTPDDEKKIPFNRDLFGRQKFGTDRDDMGGIGSFNRECKTLFLAGFKTTDPKLEEIIADNFKEFGEMEYVRMFADRGFGFVKYKSRLNAEFAKEAMHRQSLGNDEVLCVKWATEDPNPLAKDLTLQDRRMQVVEAVQKHGISTVDLPYNYPADFTPQLEASTQYPAISYEQQQAQAQVQPTDQTADQQQQQQQQPEYDTYDYYAYYQQLAAQQYMQLYQQPQQDQTATDQPQQKDQQAAPQNYNYHAYYHRLKQTLQHKNPQQNAQTPADNTLVDPVEEAPIEEPPADEPLSKRARTDQ